MSNRPYNRVQRWTDRSQVLACWNKSDLYPQSLRRGVNKLTLNIYILSSSLVRRFPSTVIVRWMCIPQPNENIRFFTRIVDQIWPEKAEIFTVSILYRSRLGRLVLILTARLHRSKALSLVVVAASMIHEQSPKRTATISTINFEERERESKCRPALYGGLLPKEYHRPWPSSLWRRRRLQGWHYRATEWEGTTWANGEVEVMLVGLWRSMQKPKYFSWLTNEKPPKSISGAAAR